MEQNNIIDIINKWTNSWFRFFKSNYGNKIDILKTVFDNYYTINLKSIYCKREIYLEYKPYKGGYVNRSPVNEEICNHPIEDPPKDFDFIKTKKKKILPGGESTRKCFFCKGKGEVNCSSCGGSGRKKVEKTVEVQSSQDTRYAGTSTKTYYEWDNCFICNGSGKVECNTCDGYGEIIYYYVLETNFFNEILFNSYIKSNFPSERLKKAKESIRDEIIIYEHAKNNFDIKLPEHVKTESNALYDIIKKQYQKALAKCNIIEKDKNINQIIYKAKTIILKIPIQNVEYKTRDSKINTLYIYGIDNKVYFHNKPYSLLKIFIVLFILIVLLTLVIILLNTL